MLCEIIFYFYINIECRFIQAADDFVKMGYDKGYTKGGTLKIKGSFMDIITLLLTSVGLAMDAFSVSVTSGILIKRLKASHALKIGLFFGLFQFLMPCFGWLLGSTFAYMVEKYAAWIAFALLGFIGGRMLWEALHPKMEEVGDPLKNKLLLVLAIATSIDALAVGVTFAAMGMSFAGSLGYAAMPSSVVIGVVAFIVSFAGVYIGNKCGNLFGNKAEIAGGVVLMMIGIKTLLTSFM